MKNIGLLIILLPILFFSYCFLNSTEHFSFHDILSKPKKIVEKKPVIKSQQPKQLVRIHKPTLRPDDLDNSNTVNVSKLQPVGNSLFNNLQCRLLTECTNDYKFTGAEFDGVKCQNDTESETATAVASIKNGFISNIHITSKGFGYTKAPLISILGGNGADASAKCIIDQKNKCLKKIQLISRGRNYTSTPTIIIEKPKSNHVCKLCCK